MCAIASAALRPEAGVQYGVSGAFGGMMGSVPVIAGGCNFPFDDPIGVPPQAKRFYRGIYNGQTGQMIAELPIETAYGASAQTSKGLVMAGGSTPQCWLLTPRGELRNLPPLPLIIDNGYGAALGNVVYICGGNQGGKPSTALWRLNLDDLTSGWQKVSEMPGRPRVQPVMAAADGKLYIWGGFVPDKPKDVLCSGLCYDPATDSWVEVEAPEEGVTLSGGVAVTLPDGRIMLTGGVNRDIFLAAIISQAPDYLFHPAKWYKFNGRTYYYNPVDGSWEQDDYKAERARAGASAALLPDGSVLLMGGEEKPRVRNPKPTRVATSQK